MPNKKLLASRRFAGIGDWMMALTVLKMVNQQYPDIDIYLNMLAKKIHSIPNKPKELPSLTQEIIATCDVKIKEFVYYETLNESSEYDYVTGHMGYTKQEGNLFIKSMVSRFNRRTGLNLQYDPSVYMQCKLSPGVGQHNKPYVLIQACTKRKHNLSQWKDYGFENMCAIANGLKKHIDIIQVGAIGDLVLPVNEKYLGTDLATLHNLMINSQGFIGMDGMLGVYAAHYNIRQYIIYTGSFKMDWTKFPNRLQINGNKTDNKTITRLIKEDLCAVNSEKQLYA